jgi:hypothetical protein
MAILLFIVITVSALSLMVYALRRHQLTEVELNADRNIPLPLLKSDHHSNFKLDEDKTSLPPRAQQQVQESPIHISWQDKVSKLKKAGELALAYTVCQQAFPLWSAYTKASVLLRTEIKGLLKSHQGVATELGALYHLAAVAELLHDKIHSEQNLSKKQMKQLDLSALDELDMPYIKLGYKFLRLLKPTDVNLMIKQWGEPKHHCQPRQLHEKFWDDLLTSAAKP